MPVGRAPLRLRECAIALACWSLTGVARAQSPEGTTAFEAGRYEEAIEQMNRAEAAGHSPLNVLVIARAHAKLGRLLASRDAYARVVREPIPPGAAAGSVDARAAAERELTALERRIPRLTVLVEGSTDDVRVTMDGAPIPVGQDVPVDPGPHELRARALESDSGVVDVSAIEGTRETITLKLVSKGERMAVEVSRKTETEGGSGGGARIAGFTALGAGLVGLTAGIIFIAQNRSARTEANELCLRFGCPARERAHVNQLDDDADAAATGAWIGMAVGVVGVALGTTLLVLAGADKKPPTEPRTGARFWLGVGSAGIGGRFP
jgi:hypothetical protein